MSRVQPDIDLSGLARAPRETPLPRRSPWRIALPVLILLIFVAVLATSLQGMFETKKSVSVIRPRAAQAHSGEGGARSTARVLLQAAGWIEPDPFAIQVTALAPGVVREVLVLEAERVTPGTVVARLVDDDARLDLAAAQAVLAQAQAELAEAKVRSEIARADFDAALAVTEGVQSADAEFAGRGAEVSRRSAAVKRAEATVRAARDEIELQRELESIGAGDQRSVDLAEARAEEAEGTVQQLQAEMALAEAEVEKAAARRVRATRDAELRLQDRLVLETSIASLERAKAEVTGAEVAVEVAQLRLTRMEIIAPAGGVVLERTAMPGTSLDGSGGASASVMTLFDPSRLRVRVDVPQSDIAKLAVGGRAEIMIDGRAGKPYHGEIVRVVEKADIQKVTLQVHVRIEDNDGKLRPEMLAQTRFLARPADGSGATDSGPEARTSDVVEVPARVVDEGRRLWIVGGVDGRARARAVELGAQTGEWVEVLSGLNLSDKVIDRGREDLREGDLVRAEGQQ